MQFKSGDFVIQNNSNRMALIVKVEPTHLSLFWTDTQRELAFPLYRAQTLINIQKWKYVET